MRGDPPSPWVWKRPTERLTRARNQGWTLIPKVERSPLPFNPRGEHLNSFERGGGKTRAFAPRVELWSLRTNVCPIAKIKVHPWEASLKNPTPILETKATWSQTCKFESSLLFQYQGKNKVGMEMRTLRGN
jgi:hypothetical protein